MKGVLHHFGQGGYKESFEKACKEKGISYVLLCHGNGMNWLTGLHYYWWIKSEPFYEQYEEWINDQSEFTLYFTDPEYREEVITTLEERIKSTPDNKHKVNFYEVPPHHGLPTLYAAMIEMTLPADNWHTWFVIDSPIEW